MCICPVLAVLAVTEEALMARGARTARVLRGNDVCAHARFRVDAGESAA